jgi:hypothetical protein
MRKRKLMIGAASALALSVAVAGVAQGAGTLTGQTITETVSSPPQDKKVPGPVTTFKTQVDTQYTGTTPPFTGKVSNDKVDFPKDFVFTPGTLPQCNPATIATADTAGALSACGASQVGSGNAVINGAVQNVQAVVTAFNGTPNEGLPTVLLHSRTGPPLNSTTVLVGTLRPGPGGAYGKTLDVNVPLLAGGAFVITSFNTAIPKKQTVKKNKKKGKPAKFYVSAKCSTKTWQFQVRGTADAGSTAPTGTASIPCKQKKSKKKKKK